MTITSVVDAVMFGGWKGSALAAALAAFTPQDVLHAYWQWLPVVVTLASVASNVIEPDTRLGRVIHALALVPPSGVPRPPK